MNEQVRTEAVVLSDNPPVDARLSIGTPVLLETEKIVDNPFQVRIQIDPVAVEGMAATIEASGLHEPIIVRPGDVPDTYQLLSGRMRVEAFRLLRGRAQTPEERQKYSAIPARVLHGVGDEVACRWSIASNVARVANNPLELSEALAKYLALTGEDEATAARKTGFSENEVAGLVRLASAPDFIKEACGRGLGDDLPAKASGQEREELARRRLKLTAAIELIHAYEYLSRHSEESGHRVTQKVKKLARQALLEDWSFRSLKAAVRELTGRRGSRSKGATASERAIPEPEQIAPRSAEEESLAPREEGVAGTGAVAPVGAFTGPGEGAGSEFVRAQEDFLKALLAPGEYPGYCVAGRKLTFDLDQFAGLTPEQRRNLQDVLFHVLNVSELRG